MIRKLLLVCLFFLSTTGAHANAMEPNELIQVTTEELLNEFTANRETYENDRNSLYEMVNRIAIPHFDFDRMTKTLLVRTYSQALFQYSDEKISYVPAVPYRDGMIVREEIDVDAAVPVRLEYFLAKKDSGWKVYDVRIDGISLVTTFRNSYNTAISQKGLPVLIADLQKKNSMQAEE